MKFGVVLLLSAAMSMASCGTSGNRNADTSDIDKNNTSPENPVATGPVGTPAFDSLSHYFGKIIDGELVQHKFKFKNTGKGDLTIANVQAHCGCTTPEWTREIIPPGGEGFVLATFNSTGKGDPKGVLVEKGVTVEFSNSTIPSLELTLKSTIFSKEESQ